MKQESKCSVELFEEYPDVSFYTVRFDEDPLSEYEKFLTTFSSVEERKEDLYIIVAWMDRIAKNGALERYFRNESKMKDGVGAVPIETAELRLYCLRITDKILIIGNGGYKPKIQKNYNTIPQLNDSVELLAGLDHILKKRISKGEITIKCKELVGNLFSFEI